MGSLERGVAVIRQNRRGLIVSSGFDVYGRARMREVAKLALLYFLGPRGRKSIPATKRLHECAAQSTSLHHHLAVETSSSPHNTGGVHMIGHFDIEHPI